MNWYLTKIVFQIICGEGEHAAQFDEQLRLIAATDEESAFEKAMSIGNGEQETFYNERQQLVQWKFINVAELYRLTKLIDGAEVYSMIKEADDEHAYINFIHHKAKTIREKYSHQLLNLI